MRNDLLLKLLAENLPPDFEVRRVYESINGNLCVNIGAEPEGQYQTKVIPKSPED